MTIVNPETRRAVAYIAARLVSGEDRSAVFDYSDGRYFNLSGQVSANKVQIYDYEQSAHIGGTPPSLFHYGNAAHLRLTVHGTSFKGFDYASSDHFTGEVSGRAVSLFDYGTGTYYNYMI